MILDRTEKTSNIQYQYKIDPGGSLLMVKTANKDYATIEDVLHTITIININNINIEQI